MPKLNSTRMANPAAELGGLAASGGGGLNNYRKQQRLKPTEPRARGGDRIEIWRVAVGAKRRKVDGGVKLLHRRLDGAAQ